MTTVDWAFVLSCLSLVIALASFVWNVWSKFIYPKPRVRVSVGIMNFIPNPDNLSPFVSLNATNHGPMDVTLYVAIAKKRKAWFKRNAIAMINPLENFPNECNRTNGPFSGGLPKKIGVGEQFSANFVLSKTWAEEGLFRFGFQDTYGRNHWCSKKNAREFVKKLSEHPEATTSED